MDREEALARSQSGEKPGGGYYTSSQRIQLRNFGLGRITRLSREVITGKSSSGGLGRGGAIVPTTKLVDPGALSPPSPPPPVDPQLIASLQKQIGEIVKKNNEQDLAKKNILDTLLKEFEFIKVSVTDLGNNLKTIRNNFVSDERLTALNAQKEETERKKASQENYRIGKEGLIEKKIMGAIMAPINAISSKIQFTLANVLKFFGILFTGWLVDKLIEGFKADSEGNKKKLNDIKNAILKNIGIAGVVLIALNLGFFRIAGTIAKLSFTVGRFLLGNVIGKLFGALASLATKASSGISGMLGMGGKSASSASAASAGAKGAASAAGPAAKASSASAGAKGAASAAGPAAKATAGAASKTGSSATKAGAAAASLSDDAAKAAAGKTAGKFVPGLGTVISGAAAAYDFSQGDILGGSLNTLGMVPGPIGWIGSLGRLGLEGSRLMGGQEQKEQESGTSQEKQQTQSLAPKIPSSSSPQNTQQQTSPVSTPQSSLSQDLNINSPKKESSQTNSPVSPTTPIIENNYSQTNAANNISVTNNNMSPLETYRKSFEQTLISGIPSSEKSKAPIKSPDNASLKPSTSYQNNFIAPPINTKSVFQENNNTSNISNYNNYANSENVNKNIINPQTSIMPMEVDYNMNLGNITGKKEKIISGYNFDDKASVEKIPEIYSSEFIFSPKSDTENKNADGIFPLSPAKTNRMPPKTAPIGPAPQPQPNVIYASSRKEQSKPDVPLKTGSSSDVPNIPSSNSDNFYLLYSQVNYNVVI